MKIEDMETGSLKKLNDLLERLSDEPAAVTLKLYVSDELNVRARFPGLQFICGADASGMMLGSC